MTAFQIGASNDVGSDASSSPTGFTSTTAGVGVTTVLTSGVGVGLISGVGDVTGLTR